MKRIALGIYRIPTGFRVFVRVAQGAGGLRSKRFLPGTALPEMKAWREDQRVEARKRKRPTPDRGTFAEDIEAYLSQVAAMPTITWRRRDLEAWRDVFGNVRRVAITAGMIRAQLHQWRTVGPVVRVVPKTGQRRLLDRPLSASACNHRRTALLHLYTVLDGKDAPNPVRAIPPFHEPAPEPRAHDLGFLEAAIGRMRNARQRARCAVLMWTGIRGNSELAAMTAAHVDLAGQVCHVPTGKGGKRFRVVPLNSRGIAAWQQFAKLKAWGEYDRHLLRRAFIRACQAEARARQITIPRLTTYSLRHSIATAYLKAGADLEDVKDMLGHSTTRMTRRYAPFQKAKLLAAAALLDRDETAKAG